MYTLQVKPYPEDTKAARHIDTARHEPGAASSQGKAQKGPAGNPDTARHGTRCGTQPGCDATSRGAASQAHLRTQDARRMKKL